VKPFSPLPIFLGARSLILPLVVFPPEVPQPWQRDPSALRHELFRRQFRERPCPAADRPPAEALLGSRQIELPADRLSPSRVEAYMRPTRSSAAVSAPSAYRTQTRAAQKPRRKRPHMSRSQHWFPRNAEGPLSSRAGNAEAAIFVPGMQGIRARLRRLSDIYVCCRAIHRAATRTAA